MIGLSGESCFVAIDFETADRGPDSACAVGLVRVDHGAISQREYRLIRPPRRHFEFTPIHGLCWQDVARQPAFPEVWAGCERLIAGAECLVAHNASFDRRVLTACCQAAGLAVPAHSFACTMQLARHVWGVRPTRLPNVCAHLGIVLEHHHALSDAEACAQIMLAIQKKLFPVAGTTAAG